MPNVEMKTLTIGDTTYEIVDDSARDSVGDLTELTTTAKTDLVSAINEAAESGGQVDSVNGKTGAVVLTAADVGAATTGALTEETTARTAADAQLQSQITALGNGAPIPVETIAAMTEQTKAYLYTGSETGESTGYWYSYDSTQAKFVPRGEYGAGVIVDDTFTIPNAAAGSTAVSQALAEKADADDLTAVDERVTALESDGSGVIPNENVSVTSYDGEINYLTQGEWTDGIYISNSASTYGREQTNDAYSVTDYLAIESTDTVDILNERANYRIYVWCYASDKSIIGRVDSGYTVANEEKNISLRENTAFIRINMPINFRTYGVYINIPISYTVMDWVDTPENRMNQLAVRQDIYDKLDSIFDGLLWNLTKWKGKTLVTDGNSLVESVNWGRYTAEALGMNFYNLGASGQNLVHNQTTMAGIRSLVANSFPASADLILLQGDSNTQTADNVNPADQMDGENAVNTWAARVNYLVRCLKAKYPNVVIALMPDSVRYDYRKENGTFGQNPPSPNIVYPNRNIYEGMKKIAEYNRHHFLAIDGDTPFNPTNYGNEYVKKTAISDFTENDGTHPGGYFAEAKGKAVAWWVAGLTYDPRANNDAVEGWENLVTATITATYGSGVTHTSNAVDIQYYMWYANTISGASSVAVTMGGTDVTSEVYNSTTGKIYITRVTGDITISAE